MKQYYCDVIVFGGGICGVWIDAFLRAKGYSTYLLEQHAIGGEQTILSQGILHKGMKYLLRAEIPKIAKLLIESTKIWEKALAGKYLVDLKKTEIYSHKQLIWNEQSFLSSFFAKGSQKMFHSEIEKIANSDIPTWLTHHPKHIFWLKEQVLNSHSMMKNFYENYKEHYYQYTFHKQNFFVEKKENLVGLKLPKEKIILWTKKMILAAGKGNEMLANILQIPYKAQLRPLRMLTVEHSNPLQIYGHCITTSSKPLFTISSHQKKNGKMLWYLGGKIAENKHTTFQEAGKILQKNIHIDLQKANWNSILTDRVEPWQKTGLLPEKPFVKNYGSSVVCSPVKLAFAPLVALEVKKILEQSNILPCFRNEKILELKSAKLAKAFYEQ